MAEKQEIKVFYLPEGRGINLSLYVKDTYTDARGREGIPSYKAELRFDVAQIDGAGTFEDYLIAAAVAEWGAGAEQDWFDGKIVDPRKSGDKLAAKREANGKPGDAYKGGLIIRAHTIFNHSGDNAPGGVTVVDIDNNPIPASAGLIFNGCYGEAAVTVSPYINNDGEKALTVYLVGFQHIRGSKEDRLAQGSDHTNLFRPRNGGATAAPAAAGGGRRSRAG